MSRSRTPRLPRLALVGLGAAWGASLLVGAPRLLRATGMATATGLDLGATRVLGARHLVQALVQAGGSDAVVRAGAAGDGVHAVTMLALAAASPRHRAAALVSAAVASTLGVLGWVAGERR